MTGFRLRVIVFAFALGAISSGAFAKPAGKPAAAKSVSFVNDVIPALTRLGCNAGTCHGAAAGKGGFKLSLRGFAPELDYAVIARQQRGRRINLIQPEQSLFIEKPLLEVAHKGGHILETGTPEYAILSNWLKQDAPGPNPHDAHLTRLLVAPATKTLAPKSHLQLKVTGVFSDGSQRDVTHWTRFATNDENVATVGKYGLVTIAGVGQTSIMVGYQDKVAVARTIVPFPNKIAPQDFAKLPRANYIDDLVYSKLAALRLPPSKPADDSRFLRRISLDLTGALPTPEEARAFAADRDPKKRDKITDALMAKPAFIDFWAYKWSDLFRVNRGLLKDKGMWAYYSYIHDSVRDNKPWDVMVREVLTSKGNTFMDGPANYFRTALKPEELAENVAQGFMGIRMQCAKCHNHPLEKWTQNEYYGMANLFARTKFKADLNIYVNDEMTVYNARTGDIDQPRLGRPVPPKPLGGPELALSSNEDRRVFFAKWLTRPDNWYFTRCIANRLWSHFMGRGLVEPVDDLRETNPPSNPELLDALANDLTSHHFDLRHLMRRIVSSQAYQRSSAATPQNAPDERYYSHFLPRRLTAEEALDALSQVTGKPEEFPGLPPGYRAVQLPDTKVKSDFMDVLGRPARVITCECERSQEPSMAQALIFINGDLLNKKITADGGTADRLVKSGKSDSEILDELYWTAFGRPPLPKERESNLAALHKALAVPPPASDNPKMDAKAKAELARRKVWEDMLWALVNSKEFMFNH